MKTSILALGLGLGLVACAGSDQRPAQDPTAANTAPAASPVAMNDTTAAPTVNSTSSPSSNVSGSPSTADDTSTRPGAPTMGVTSAQSSSAPQPQDATGSPPQGAAPAPTNPDADNTRVNRRDSNLALTPMDQGKSDGERKISARVRQAMMSDDSLSFTAKNVKIITIGSKVTLRGPVRTAAERATIENLARQTAGVTDVDDQLEIKK